MENIDFKLVGDRLKKARLEKGMTQLELAKEVGLSYAWYLSWKKERSSLWKR